MRARWKQAVVMALVAAAGVWAYGRIVRPDRSLIAKAAERRLREIFGPDVTYDSVRIDLVKGVEVRGLKVRTPATTEPTLVAERVEVRHDVLALASGAYRPEAIVIEKARVVTRETESGIAPDFPFTLAGDDTGRPMPRLEVSKATLFYRAMPASKRLREGVVLVFDDVSVDAAPDPSGRTRVSGGFRTRGLDQDDVRIAVAGWADEKSGALQMQAVWNPFRLSPNLLDNVLAEEISSRLRGRSLDEGRLEVALSREAGRGEEDVQVAVLWEGRVRMDVAEIPGGERIDARTKEQLQALLGPGKLTFEVTPQGIDIKGLATALGGGSVEATGRIEDEGEAFRLDIRVRGLRIEDPGIRKALGEEGAKIFDQFQAAGRVDADAHIVKERGKDVDFEVNAILDGVSFRYIGALEPDGTRAGFPYRVVDASGTVRLTPGLVEFGDIVGVGAHTMASFMLRGRARRSWTGGETGRILVTPAGPDIRLTVEGTHVPVDADLEEAVAGSEFAGLLDTYRLKGVVDKFEIDVLSVPGLDAVAKTEVKVTLGNEDFRYAKFPLDLEGVTGWVTMRRPILPTSRADGVRGRVFAFDVNGRMDGAPAHVWAEYRAHELRGRLHIAAEAVPLAGQLTHAILTSPETKDGLGAVWRFFEPRGRADLEGEFPLEEDPEPMRLTIVLKDASVRLDAQRAATPVELAHLGGRIEVVDDTVRAVGIRGTLGDARVTLDGTIDGGTEGRWDLRLDTDVIRLTAPLLAEISRLSSGDSLLPAGFRLEPDGRMALAIHLRRETGPAGTLRADVTATRIDASVALPGGRVVAVRGDRLEVEGETLRLENVVAEAPGISITAKRARLGPDGVDGAFSVALERFATNDEALGLLPAEVREDLAPLLADRLLTTKSFRVEAPEAGGVTLEGDLAILAQPSGPAGTGPVGTLSVAPLVVSPATPGGRTLSGVVRFQDLTFDPGLPLEKVSGAVRLHRLRLGTAADGTGALEGLSGKVGGITVKDLSAPVTWHDGVLTLDPIRGTVARGTLIGRLHVRTREPEAYEGFLRVDGFRLEALREDLAPTGPPYAGRGEAQIRFENRGTGVGDLQASGTIRVRDGNLGDLPAVANIFALVGGVFPSQVPPKFERADVEFTLRDEVIRFRRLDLAGPLFDMPGHGTLDLTGVIDVTFTPDFVKSMLLPGSMQLPVIGEILGVVLSEELFYAVRVRGDLETAEPTIVPFPPLQFGPDTQAFEGTGVPQALPRPLPRWFR